MPPKITGVLETVLYVSDPDRSQRFYESVFGFRLLVKEDGRLHAMQVKDGQLLLLFKQGASPDHDGSGQVHLAFSIPKAELAAWELWLAENHLEIIERKKWEYGGESLYFRDPDGHLLEVATPGVWPVF